MDFVGESSIAEYDFDLVDNEQVLVSSCGASGIIRGNAVAMVNTQSPEGALAIIQVHDFGLKIESVPCHE
jgi:hypothetical protein